MCNRNAFQRISAGNSKQDASRPLTSQVSTEDVLPSVSIVIRIASLWPKMSNRAPNVGHRVLLSLNVKGKSLLLFLLLLSDPSVVLLLCYNTSTVLGR